MWNARFGEERSNGDCRLYYNMKEIIEPNMQIIDLAHRAMESLNITPKIQPFAAERRLAFLHGLPCPNLFTAGITSTAGLSSSSQLNGKSR